MSIHKVIEKRPIPKDERLQLGQRVKVRAKLHRNKGGLSLSWDRVPHITIWGTKIEPEGTVVGVRTVYEGSTDASFEGGSEFKADKAIGVYLVAINMAQILHVLPDDLTLLDTPPQQGWGDTHG